MTKEELKAYRESIGLTQDQFAKRLGLARSRTISDYERGERNIPGWLISRIELEKQSQQK
jgi:transcriptional regulator with XRE-family HTH domain